MKRIRLAYIGGGSKQWARVFMNDLALSDRLSGEIALYDIDLAAALRNKSIGERINNSPDTVSHWDYIVCESLEQALRGADFVVLSILPGTFDEMQADVHLPEKYGIYQSVGDTVGPGGVLRSMRTVPIYESFALAIKEYCPSAWVVNLTNPMSICVKTLYDVFPQIKAFGCCHEVFHAQEFLCAVYAEVSGKKRPMRSAIKSNASGINHFTWITEATCRGENVMDMLTEFIDRYYSCGYCEMPNIRPDGFNDSPFFYGNKVKMELFNVYGALGAAGDRHLVEFLENARYLKSEAYAESYFFHLTSVAYRKKQQAELIAQSIDMANGNKPVIVHKSDEEVVEIMCALLGFGDMVTNVNYPNIGQMECLPKGSIVETDCVIDCNGIKPIASKGLPSGVKKLVICNNANIECCFDGIKNRDLGLIFESFINQPLCSALSFDEGKRLFKEMTLATHKYLEPYFGSDRGL